MSDAWINFTGLIVGALVGGTAVVWAAIYQARLAKELAAAQAREAAAQAREAAKQHELDEAKKRLDAYTEAPHIFVDNLGRIITGAVRAIDVAGYRDLRAYARAIVSARDSLAEPLKGLNAALNSEIDTLKRLLNREALPDDEELARTIKALSIVWPIKRDEMELRMRQLQAVFASIQRPTADPESYGLGIGQPRTR
jgi:hypothetical protein